MTLRELIRSLSAMDFRICLMVVDFAGLRAVAAKFKLLHETSSRFSLLGFRLLLFLAFVFMFPLRLPPLFLGLIPGPLC